MLPREERIVTKSIMNRGGTEQLHKNRIVWVDVLKFVCIFFVVLTHMEAKSTILSRFFLTFFLTGFLLASGYVYKHRIGFKAHLIKKCKQLLVPWFTFSTANILLSQLVSFSDEHLSLQEELKWNLLQIRGINDGMWFVSALFSAYIFFYFFVDRYEKSKVKNDNAYKKYLALSLLLFFIYEIYINLVPGSIFPYGSNRLPWHIEYIPFAVFYMFVGYIFRERVEVVFDRLNSRRNRLMITITFLVVLYLPLVIGVTFKWHIGAVYTLIIQMLGLVTMISFCKEVTPTKLILYIGQNTLIYFGLHSKVVTFIEAILKKTIGNKYSHIIQTELLAIPYLLVMTCLVATLLIIPTWMRDM